MDVTVTVDHELCQGHGQCQESAPELFEVRDDGFAYVLRPVDSPPLLEKVRDAASRCPVEAVLVRDAGS
jgi:ferredoxin